MAPVDVGSLEPHESQLNNSENLNFDIFENSSPQRPIHTPGSATEVNFSRKRTHNGRIPNATEPSKRPRPADWPLSPSKQNRTVTPMFDNPSTELPNPPSPGRASKFLEASMHDRPSEKPPSVFTRAFKVEGHNNMEALMENYMASLDSTLPTHTVDQEMQIKGLTHHPNMSITSSTTDQTVDTAYSKKSSIFRFGRSMASAFNPLTIWNNLSSNWHHTKDQLIQEAEDERQKQWDERKSKAEQAYAELKKAGYPGIQCQNRDSGVEMDDKSRSSTEQEASNATESNTGLKMRRPSLHFRTPSLSNLKKMASDVNLHKRSRSASISMSPEKQDTVEVHGLYHSSSKKDLNRQAKLTKRVSNLEAKLEIARKELREVMGDVPPVPPIPPMNAVETPKSRSTSSGRIGLQRKFAPLPSLPSESLLFADAARDSVPDIADQYFEAEAKEDVRRDVSTVTEVKEPTKIKYAFTVKDEFKEPEKRDKVTLSTPKKFMAPTSFFHTSSPQVDEANFTPNKATPAKAKIIKRRKSHDADLHAAESNNNNVESAGTTRATKKPKHFQQSSDQALTNTTSKASPSANKKQPTASTPPTKFPSRRSSKPHVLSKPLPSIDAIATTDIETNSPRTPRHRHQRSLSPVKATRQRSDYRQRSKSPPHVPAPRSKGGVPETVVKARKRMDDAVSVTPDGKDVPPVPEVRSGTRIEKEEWVWPEDVF